MFLFDHQWSVSLPGVMFFVLRGRAQVCGAPAPCLEAAGSHRQIVLVAGQVSVLIGVTSLPSCHTLLSNLLESLLWILLIFTILQCDAPVAPVWPLQACSCWSSTPLQSCSFIPLVLVLPHCIPAAAPGNGHELVAPASSCLYLLHLLSILLGFLLYCHFPSFAFYLNKNATLLDHIFCNYKLDFSQSHLADIHLTSLSSLDLASELVSSTNAMNLPLPPLATS